MRSMTHILRKLADLSIKEVLRPVKFVWAIVEVVRFRLKTPPKTCRILFASNLFAPIGGIETRLLNLAYSLHKKGKKCVFVAGEVRNKEIERWPSIELPYRFPDYGIALLLLVALLRPGAIEFQSAGSNKIPTIIIFLLRRITRVGFCIHGDYVNPAEIKRVDPDFLFAISRRLINRYSILLEPINIRILEHVFPSAEHVSKRRCCDTALIISRLDREKQDSIRSAIEIAAENGLKIVLAGEAVFNRGGAETLFPDGMSTHVHFVGNIITNQYLREHGSNYALVFGVGQAAIEAALTGIPVVIPSHLGAKHSRFVTRENFTVLADHNWTIKEQAVALEIRPNLKNYLPDIIAGRTIPQLNVIDLMETRYSEDRALDTYKEVLDVMP